MTGKYQNVDLLVAAKDLAFVVSLLTELLGTDSSKPNQGIPMLDPVILEHKQMTVQIFTDIEENPGFSLFSRSKTPNYSKLPSRIEIATTDVLGFYEFLSALKVENLTAVETNDTDNACFAFNDSVGPTIVVRSTATNLSYLRAMQYSIL